MWRRTALPRAGYIGVLFLSVLSPKVPGQEPAKKEAAPKQVPTVTCTWDTLLPAWLSFQRESISQYGEHFLATFHPDEYKQIREDEFRLRRRVQQAVKESEDLASRFDPTTNYLFEVELKLGSYDFEKQAFPIENVTSDRYWDIASGNRRVAGMIPSRFYLYLVNPSLMSSVPMAETTAEQWLQSRKGDRGNIDRRVRAKLRFQLLKNGVGGYSESFQVNLLSGVVYDPQTNRELNRFTKPLDDTTDKPESPPIP